MKVISKMICYFVKLATATDNHTTENSLPQMVVNSKGNSRPFSTKSSLVKYYSILARFATNRIMGFKNAL